VFSFFRAFVIQFWLRLGRAVSAKPQAAKSGIPSFPRNPSGQTNIYQLA
jgi:hypothetical protein